MNLIPAKCPNCGALLNISGEGKADICNYCGTAFIVQEAINNFSTTYNVVNNIQAQNVIVKQEDPRYLDFLQTAKVELNEIKDYDYFQNTYSSVVQESKDHILKKYFDKPDMWYVVAYQQFYRTINSIDLFEDTEWVKSFQKAISLSNDNNQRTIWESEIRELDSRQQTEIQNRIKYKNELDNLISHPESLDGYYIYEYSFKINNEEYNNIRHLGFFGYFLSYNNELYFIYCYDYGNSITPCWIKDTSSLLNIIRMPKEDERSSVVSPYHSITLKSQCGFENIITHEITEKNEPFYFEPRRFHISVKLPGNVPLDKRKIYDGYINYTAANKKELGINLIKLFQGHCLKCGSIIQKKLFGGLSCSPGCDGLKLLGLKESSYQ